jgi:GT2 family glycosyltransferase
MMYSIVICSKDEARFSAVSANIEERFAGFDHEIVRIPDARSLAEGYNRGVAQARGQRLVLCHDDIEVLNQDVVQRLDEHLAKFDIVGIAGADRVIIGSWAGAGPLHTFGQVAQRADDGGFAVFLFATHKRAFDGIQALDGVFFAVNRRVFDKISFDARTFDGFHLYDLDFTFAAHLAGFQIGVASDVHVLHASMGSWDEAWRRYSTLFRMKYAKQLYPAAVRKHLSARIFAGTKQECAEIMREATPK